MNNKIIIIGIVALLLGFLLAWFVKPNATEEAHDHVNSEVSDKEEIWTCSMHPQIRRNEPGDCPICGMDLIPLDESGSGSGGNYFEMTEEAVQLANITTLKITLDEQGKGNELLLNGRIESDETRSSSLVTHVPGRIEELFVRFTGEFIAKGSKIASVYSPELIIAQKELIEVQKLQDLSPGLVEAVKNKLRFWKISTKDIENILNTGKIKEQFNIYSDHSGTVINKNVQIGDYINTGQVLLDVQDLSKVWILFEVYESDLEHIELENEVTFTTSSIPGKTFRSSVTFIDPIVDPNTRVVKVRAEINNSDRKLKPDMFVHGKLIGKQTRTGTITIPKSAVLWTGKRSVVYVKVPDTVIPSYEFREVVLGPSLGDHYTVTEGLNRGEEIVVNGAFVIDAASQLSNKTSMMNQNVKLKSSDEISPLPNFSSDTPLEFKQQLEGAVNSYLEVKDALVKSDPNQANIKAKELVQQLNKIDMMLLMGEAHNFWMQKFNAISAHAEKIASSVDLDFQRTQFDFLSSTLIESLKVYGVASNTLYIQHCPMAINNTGADWISKEEFIQNPYFGDKMMKCGTIEDTLKIN